MLQAAEGGKDKGYHEPMRARESPHVPRRAEALKARSRMARAAWYIWRPSVASLS